MEWIYIALMVLLIASFAVAEGYLAFEYGIEVGKQLRGSAPQPRPTRAIAPPEPNQTTCPECGHGEATIVGPAEPTGFIETCLKCDHTFVDPTE